MTLPTVWPASAWENAHICRVMLSRDEGIRRQPYKCPAGHWTIGIGRNLDANPLTDDEIAVLLDADIDRARHAAIEIFTPEFFENIEGERQLAIVNLIFNMGKAGFLTFRHTIEAMKERNWERAANEILNSKYAHQVGARAGRIAALLRLEWQY